eukprot:TRINITY_DN34285_c0_g1_i2.p1 TRINITY_DN34285_c0_g1~~TRINITY_DN34285_c0_g1_i2.p1  ORF type:complete len:126 (-),score=21.92 TRINITY_DN34285_c0_g1_i2:549-926(-)
MVYHIRSQQISTVRYCLIAHTNLLLECSVFTVVLYLALQRHYAILEALALGDDEMPETADETVPDEEGMARPGVVNALEDYKVSVYGENHDQEEAENNAAKSTISDTAKKAKSYPRNSCSGMCKL